MSRARAWSGLTGLLAAVLVVATLTPTSAAYRDDTYAKTATIGVSVQPDIMAGLTRTGRMVDSGVAATATGAVYVWGGTVGLTGAATSGLQMPAQQVPFPTGTVIKQVTGQIYDANALDSRGRVWGWGNFSSRNGTDAGSAGDPPQLIRIGTASTGTGAVLDTMLWISSTEQAGAGIRQDGTVWTWGNSSYGGNTGKGASQVSGLPTPSVAGNRPVWIQGGYQEFFVILENGNVYFWGSSSSLPTGTRPAAKAAKVSQLAAWMRPNVAAGAPSIVAVGAGISLGAALLSDGTVVSWGTGATGRGSAATSEPAVIPTLSGITSMAFGFTGAVLLDSKAQLWGYGTSTDKGNNPTLPTVIDTNVVQFAAGQGYYLWQRRDGTFWGKGYDPSGAIGVPVTTSVATPRSVTFWDNSSLQVIAR